MSAPPGRRTVNTEPLPGSLVTVTSPPIMRARQHVAAGAIRGVAAGSGDDQPDLTLDEIVDAHPRFRPSVNYLTFGRQKICEPYAAKLKATGRDSMRTAWIGLAVVVAIGLIWSVAATSKWVPVNSAEISSAAMLPHPRAR
jgi:hypothetical protein